MNYVVNNEFFEGDEPQLPFFSMLCAPDVVKSRIVLKVRITLLVESKIADSTQYIE